MQNIKTEPNIGNRFVAGLVDYIIIFGFTIYMVYTFGEPNSEGGKSLNGILAFIPMLFWFLMTVVLEMSIGRTVGNLMVGLRAIPIDGTIRKLTFSESFKRHLLDPLDFCSFGIIAIITIKNTEKNQRLGDLWAKTIVVSNKIINKT